MVVGLALGFWLGVQLGPDDVIVLSLGDSLGDTLGRALRLGCELGCMLGEWTTLGPALGL